MNGWVDIAAVRSMKILRASRKDGRNRGQCLQMCRDGEIEQRVLALFGVVLWCKSQADPADLPCVFFFLFCGEGHISSVLFPTYV